MSHHYEGPVEERACYTQSEMIRMVDEAQKQALSKASYDDLVKELEKRQRTYHDTLVGIPTDVLRKELQRREEDSMKPKLLVETE